VLTVLKDLFRPPARSAAPRSNPDDPCGDGWRRADLPEGRPVRYRLAVPAARDRLAAKEKQDRPFFL
jgi:hypothetical protein